jgi:hypothetical protein
MKIDKSDYITGWIGLFTEDEDGRLEETHTFQDIKTIKTYIKELTKELKEYEKRRIRAGGKKVIKCINCGGGLHFSFTKQGWYHIETPNHKSCLRAEPSRNKKELVKNDC